MTPAASGYLDDPDCFHADRRDFDAVAAHPPGVLSTQMLKQEARCSNFLCDQRGLGASRVVFFTANACGASY